MICSSINTANPYVWIFFAGIFFGATINRLTLRPARAVYPERARTVKWVLFCIYLSLTIVFGMLALFISGPKQFLDINLVYYFIGIGSFVFLGLRFKRMLGVLFLTIVILSGVLFLSYIQYWQCREESRTVAEFRFLAERQEPMQMVVYSNGDTSFYKVEQTYFAPVLTRLHIHRGYLFGTDSTLYRLEGFNEYSDRDQQQSPETELDYRYTGQRGTDSWFTWLEQLVVRLPGIEKVKHEAEPFRPLLFQRYALIIGAENELRIEPVVD